MSNEADSPLSDLCSIFIYILTLIIFLLYSFKISIAFIKHVCRQQGPRLMRKEQNLHILIFDNKERIIQQCAHSVVYLFLINSIYVRPP